MSYRLLTLLLVLAGCDRAPAPGLAPQPATTSSDIVTTADVPAAAASIGLGLTATPDEMLAVEKRLNQAGAFRGQGCGITTLPDGTTASFVTNLYSVETVGDGERHDYLRFGHIAHSGYGIVSVSGPGFNYRLRDGVFVLVSDASSLAPRQGDAAAHPSR